MLHYPRLTSWIPPHLAVSSASSWAGMLMSCVVMPNPTPFTPSRQLDYRVRQPASTFQPDVRAEWIRSGGYAVEGGSGCGVDGGEAKLNPEE